MSVSPWRVDIETEDCGKISYFGAFTEEDSQNFASGMVPGATYEFKLGALSRAAMKWPVLVSPSAEEIREANISAP